MLAIHAAVIAVIVQVPAQQPAPPPERASLTTTRAVRAAADALREPSAGATRSTTRSSRLSWRGPPRPAWLCAFWPDGRRGFLQGAAALACGALATFAVWRAAKVR